MRNKHKSWTWYTETYLNHNVLGTTHTERSVVHLSALSKVTATACIEDKFCTHSALYLKSGPSPCIFKVINSTGPREKPYSPNISLDYQAVFSYVFEFLKLVEEKWKKKHFYDSCAWRWAICWSHPEMLPKTRLYISHHYIMSLGVISPIFTLRNTGFRWRTQTS